jgi:cytoskeletal protein CcmA (bactofilin family)
MWTKQSQNDVSKFTSAGGFASQVPAFSATPGTRPGSSSARNLACLGASLEFKGKISGEEDLEIDGKVEGPVSLPGQRLTVGRSGQLNSEIIAREVIVYGKVTGNLRARERVEIKKDGSVVGDITTSRISIEDGAYFKGHIEIERAKASVAADLESVAIPVGTEAN